MKTKRLINLHRKAGEIADEARAIHAEMDGAAGKKLDDLAKRHDQLMRDFDQNRLNIAEEELRVGGEERGDDAAAASRRPPMGGEGYGQDDEIGDVARAWAGEARSGWADQNGNAVRVLRPNDLWATERAKGVALGDAVRAMITGPRNELEKRALGEGTNSAGGYTVPSPLAAMFIDRLRSQSVAVRAGAMTVPMDSQTLAIARLETDPTIGWRAENASLAEGDPTFGRVLLTAKSLAGIVKVSRELLMDTVNAGAILEQAFTKAMALEIDRAAIYGDGSGNSPTGVINTSGINEVSMGTNGAALANYDKLIDTIYEMQLDNAADPTAMIMHPRTQASLAKLKDGDNNPMTVPEMIARIPRLATTAASVTETQGTSNVASSIVFGDFRHLFIGLRENITIQLLDQLYAANGQIALAVHARVDVQLAHKESFSRLKGITVS